MSLTEKLVEVTAYTRDGKPGRSSILSPENVDWWIQKYGQEMLAEGCVRVVVTDYVRTNVIGDKRRRR